MEEGNGVERRALRLRTLAEQKFKACNIASALQCAKEALRLCPTLEGLPQMLTAFRVLGTASTGATRDWYQVLQLQPFSHPNAIKKQYKKLALSLHPDKNPFVASEEAFKLVGEAFRVLSDKARRKEYDKELRSELEATVLADGGGDAVFRSACSHCGFSHQFPNKYAGQNLMCKRCGKSFLAAEVAEEGLTTRPRVSGVKRRTREVGDVLERCKWRGVGSATTEKRGRRINQKPEKEKWVEDEMTLAEMQLIAKKMKTKKKKKLGVVDMELYDFDKDRTEKCFRKGQVWAMYGEEEGMARDYGVVVDVVSQKPFNLKLKWLQVEGDEEDGWGRSWGRFRVSREGWVDSVSIFSHIVDCERVGRELYQVFPRKGSIWALSNFQMVVCLTSYTDMGGVSVATLQKLPGRSSVFKREEMGFHAITCMVGKDQLRLFSHFIPSRPHSLPSGEVCWEMDPASLPPQSL